MTFERYAEWLARGRAHQADDRSIDALLCYRRALREAPRGVEAQFHIGEIAWRLGNPAEAINAWRAASGQAPSHVASWQALVEAHVAAGDFDAGSDAARSVLALHPHQRRARALLALLDPAGGAMSDTELAQALQGGLRWPLALLARVIERALAPQRAGGLPATLAAALDAAANATVTRGGEDGLRRIAVALAGAADGAAAQAFADCYAQACRALHRPSMPLTWPRRTAGAALRVGVLVAPGRTGDAAALQAAQARDGCEFDGVAFVEADEAGAAPSDANVRAIPPVAETAARALASLDLDVLIDLAGVSRPWGPLLALRPVRTIWSVERAGIPALHALADRTFAQGDAAADAPAGGAGAQAGDAVANALAAALHELRASIAVSPASPTTARELADRFTGAVEAHRAGDVAAARSGYASVLAAQPDHAPTLHLAAELARDGGDEAAAVAHLRAAVRAAPGYVDARAALVHSLISIGERDDAAEVARAGLPDVTESAALWRALGQAELARGEADAAIAAFDEALKRDPANGEAHYNQGVALQTARLPAEAARAYQRALAFRPDLYAADFNLGVIFDQQGDAAAAITAFSNVLQQAPSHVGAYKALAETLLAAGRIDAWFANFERFEQNCPGDLALAAHALEVCAYRADFERLERYLDGLRHERFTSGRPQDMLDALQLILYLLHFFDVEPDLIGRYARTHDALARSLYGEPWPRRAPRRPGKLRIGYLSGDFRNHVMGKMMWEALRRHDRTRFDIVGYATVDARDEWTARFESAFAGLPMLGALSDRAAARRIAEDDLDVLVDLSTHTKGSRPGILALKPARVQITHVASAGTLAMSAIDFKLTDRYADLPHDPLLQIEPLLAMEGCVYPYRHIEPADAAAFTRAALGIARDAVVIGAFCTPLKLSQRCLALWREVLTRVERAVLAFSPVQPALRDVYQRIAAVARIEPQRIVFVPQGRDDAEKQARYRLVDFVLDPLPYGGANGTLEALDMGVPVVTLLGGRHAERSSYSILANLGVTETIAQTGGDYVAIAVRLATDPGFMRTVRERIAAGLQHSPLTDMDRHTHHLEAAYVGALEACAPGVAAEAAP